MESFERAHNSKNKSSKTRILSENKKKQLKQMLLGYKENDNKLIQMSTQLQSDYDDSTSVSGYSDLNLTTSSYEDENATRIVNQHTSTGFDSKDMISNSNSDDKIYEDLYSECSKSSELSYESVRSDSYDNISNEDKSCFSDEPTSEGNSSLTNDFDNAGCEDVVDSYTDTETSVVMSGLNLSGSDISEFDADRQLAAKIQERLLLKNNKQMHKDKNTIIVDENIKAPLTKGICSIVKTEKVLPINIKNKKRKHKDKDTILLDSNELPKGPINIERCNAIQAEKLSELNKKESKRIKKNKQKHKNKYTILLDPKYNISQDSENSEESLEIERSTDNSSVYSDEQNEQLSEDIDSVISPPYVSITASDMSTQRLDDIIGEYKHSTIKNLPSKTSLVVSTNNSGFFVEENMDVDVHIEDDVSSLIPELDGIPKLEEIDEEVINLDTTVEAETIGSNHTLELKTCTSGNEKWIDYNQVAETFKVYYGTNCCIIALKHPCELFIQGKVKVKSLGGTVELFGYTLNKQIHNIYAPYYNFAQVIKTVENQNNYYGLFGKLTAVELSVSEAEEIVTTMGENDAVILLRKLNCFAMDFVEDNFRITNIFKSNKTIEPYFNKAALISNCSLFSSQPYKCFNEHPSWREANELAMIAHSRGIVCGGKGTGKSTYVRYQVNKLLAHSPVLVIDLDPGQCLFTVAGNISATVVKSPLLGPSFTQLRKPEMMLNIGIINTMDNAKLYATAVQTLITQCQSNKAFNDMPWIVNTMGMTNSLGLKFMSLIITLFQPTYVLQYESTLVNQRFQTLLTPTCTKELFEDYRNDRLFENVTYPEDLDYSFVVAHVTDSPHCGKSTYNLRPKDERYLNFLAYFSQLLLGSCSQSLLGITPFEVNLKHLHIASNVIIKKEHIMKVLNGKLVALCQQTSKTQCDSNVFTLTDNPLLCRGHGLIRGVDWDKDMLYIITPVVGEELTGVDTLLYADWMPELIWYERSLPAGTALPYRTSTTDQQKQLMSTPRRRFNNPLQLLKMARGAPN